MAAVAADGGESRHSHHHTADSRLLRLSSTQTMKRVKLRQASSLMVASSLTFGQKQQVEEARKGYVNAVNAALQKPSGETVEALVESSSAILNLLVDLLQDKNGDAQVENRSTSILDILIDVSSLYSFEKELGRGHYGVVYKAISKNDGSTLCLKKMMKTKLNKRKAEMFRKEVAIMRMMDCPNIIKLHGCYEDSEAVYLAQEMCTGGELFYAITERGTFTEREAASVMQDVLSAVRYCHEHDIVHRDLKPENILFEKPIGARKPGEALPTVKIIDFGLSTIYHADVMLAKTVGTPYYVAPEVLSRKYSKECDLWSCGIILYILLCGYPPFYGDSNAQIYKAVKEMKLSFPSEDWGGTSKEARDLISKLLRRDPAQRFSAAQALEHTWIKEQGPKHDLPLRANFLEQMEAFSSQDRFRKVSKRLIAEMLSSEEINNLREEFYKIDKDRNGIITKVELREALSNMASYGGDAAKLNARVNSLISGMDLDGDGNIEYSEFLTASMNAKNWSKRDRMRAVFNQMDNDRTGTLTVNQICEALGGRDDILAIEIVGKFDKDGDGVISFEEFEAFMNEEISSHDQDDDDVVMQV